MRLFCSMFFPSIVLTLCIALLTNIGFAQVMSSSNFQIQSDSINVAGGFSTSANYQIESSVGESATGDSASGSYELRAGYQQMLDSYIALSVGGDISLSPTIPGVSGGLATGSTSVTVITDSIGGYQLTIQAENSPAMVSGPNTISDYVPATAAPDFAFTTTVADAHFGFSPEGADVVQRYLDDAGGACDEPGGTDTADACWDGLSTSATTVARGSGSNHPVGTETTIKFQVGIGGSVVQQAGNYVATTTITASSL